MKLCYLGERDDMLQVDPYIICYFVDDAVDCGFGHIKNTGYNTIRQSMSQPENIDEHF